MTDRELLELAAKAAGLQITNDCHIPSGGMWVPGEDGDEEWSPLADDGDALRLAVKLDITVYRFGNMTTARPLLVDWGCDERDDGDAASATRRAIVRAAAEIGQTIP